MAAPEGRGTKVTAPPAAPAIVEAAADRVAGGGVRVVPETPREPVGQPAVAPHPVGTTLALPTVTAREARVAVGAPDGPRPGESGVAGSAGRTAAAGVAAGGSADGRGVTRVEAPASAPGAP